MIAFGISVLYFCGGLLGLAIFAGACLWFATGMRRVLVESWHHSMLPENRWRLIVLGLILIAPFAIAAADVLIGRSGVTAAR